MKHKNILNSNSVLWFGIAILIAWLASSNGLLTENRRKTINDALNAGKIGKINSKLQENLQQQVLWIAKYANITKSIAVNNGISSSNFNIIVTNPKLESITHCGKGNAIYDESLDTIFVDEYLLVPIDLTHIGIPGASTMFSTDEIGFIVSDLSFILAHEMGHRQNGHKAAAFFALDWLNLDRSATEQELTADRFATRTLMQAFQAGDAPKYVQSHNALDATGLGLNIKDLTTEERAAADIMGSMIGMSISMQFASSPYSPYFRDAAHPSFLERAATAIEQVSAGSGKRILDQAPVMAEQIRRTRALGYWAYNEIHVPDPLARVELRGGVVWIGTRSYTDAGSPQSRERLFRLDWTQKLPNFVFLKEGHSDPKSELAGAWLDAVFEHGDSSSGLPPIPKPDIHEERLFKPYRKWNPNGLAYDGQAWFWKNGRVENVMAVKDFEHQAKQILKTREVQVGKPQRFGATLVVPTVVVPAKGSSRLRMLSIKNGQVYLTPSPQGTDFTPSKGWINVEGVIRDADRWLVPGEVATETEDTWKLWTLPDRGKPDLAADGRLLSSFIGPAGDASAGRDLSAKTAHMLPLGSKLFLVWFDSDSVWLVGPEGVSVAFHPAPQDLKITAVGNGSALFWIENAAKVYLVDFRASGEKRKGK